MGSNVDVNGDGLPDVVVQYVNGHESALATYLNTGKGYCISFENPEATSLRTSSGFGTDIPPCSSIPSMHDPKEDTRVTKFLASIDLAEYAPAFAEHKVDYETLLGLNESNLKEMGIKALGARKRIAAKQRLLALADQQFKVPFAANWWHGSYGNEVMGQSLDVNGDGLPDWAITKTTDNTHGSLGTYAYLNTGKDYCVSWENDLAHEWRMDNGAPNLMNCTSLLL
jgi:hypothetical protein